MKKYLHAWFSSKAACRFGSWGMNLITGREVRITCVDEEFMNNAHYYQWPDKVYLGMVKSDSYHDYWRGDEDIYKYGYEYHYEYDSLGRIGTVVRPYRRLVGGWTNKYHSIESYRSWKDGIS